MTPGPVQYRRLLQDGTERLQIAVTAAGLSGRLLERMSSTPSESDPRPENGPASAPQARPFHRRRWFRGLVFLAFLYCVWCAVLYVVQDWLLFPTDLTPEPLPLLYDATTTELTLDTEEGTSVAWFIPALGLSPDKPAPVVVFFHGNAELIDYQSTIVEGYRKLGCSVLLPEYRGYGRSDGTPSERAIVADAVRFYDALVQRPDVAKTRLVIHGRSLGGGPAAQLASRRGGHPLILESTFASAAAMAHKYFAPTFLAKHAFRTDRVLDALDDPILIFHGTRDTIISVSHGRKLRDVARDATYIEYDCGHNDFPGRDNEEAYWNEIADFLKRTGIINDETP